MDLSASISQVSISTLSQINMINLQGAADFLLVQNSRSLDRHSLS